MMQADVHEAPEKLILRNLVICLVVFAAGVLLLKSFLLGLLLGCGVGAGTFFYLGQKKRTQDQEI